jgi:chorismate mutase
MEFSTYTTNITGTVNNGNGGCIEIDKFDSGNVVIEITNQFNDRASIGMTVAEAKQLANYLNDLLFND